MPITLHQKGEQNFDLSKLFLNKEGKQAKGAEEAKVTIGKDFVKAGSMQASPWVEGTGATLETE